MDSAFEGMQAQYSSIYNCDQHRVIQIMHQERTYAVVQQDARGIDTHAVPVSTVRSGAKVHVTVKTVDTGERKNLFGFIARHVKETETVTSDTNACANNDRTVERDGWFIDLPQRPGCVPQRRADSFVGMLMIGGNRNGKSCVDDLVSEFRGPRETGFPVKLHDTIRTFGSESWHDTEVVEISNQLLDPKLFEVPRGYRELKPGFFDWLRAMFRF
jgi:hypothetical protein